MKALVSALLLLVIGLGSSSPALADDNADGARVEALLHQAGYTYERKSSTIFVIPQHRTNLGDFRVVLACGNGLLVTFVTTVKKSRMNMTAAFAAKLLAMNHTYDKVKVEIDDDGDLAIRDDASIRVLDETELKDDVSQVAASADEIFAAIKSDLN